VAKIVASGGRVDMARIARQAGVSRQHLARRFATWVGITPKTLSRVVRLREVLRAARGPAVNWAALAADLGYCDQSHLVAEFRSLTGLTPALWRSGRRRGSKSPIAPVFASLS
jgi:AraC-like DNA-binding protein